MSINTKRITAARAHLQVQAWQHLEGSALIKAALQGTFDDPFIAKVAVSSSFGAEAAVLLSLVAEVDANVPVIFIDTGKLHPETLSYRDTLTKHLGLTNVQTHQAQPSLVTATDPGDDLHKFSPEACCQVRKVDPFTEAIRNFDVIITGRKRFHGGERSDLKSTERHGRQVKVNPLANWTELDIKEYFLLKQLPLHPLLDKGYASIGCAPCTRKLETGENVRAGRWCGNEKTECGIHNAPQFEPEKHLMNWS